MAGRRLKPRSRPAYDNKQHSRTDSFLPGDDHTLRADVASVTLKRPNKKNGKLIVRPWPQVDYDDPEVLSPGRRSAENRSQTDWAVFVPAVKFIGLPDDPKFTFITHAPWEDSEKKFEHPYAKLYYGVKSAKRQAGQNNSPPSGFDLRWMLLLEGGKNRGASLQRPDPLFYMQGTVYQEGDKDYPSIRDGVPLGEDPGDDTVIIQATKATGTRLFDLLDTPKENFTGNEETEPWKAFKYGDAVGVYNSKTGGVAGGLIVTIFHPEVVQISEHTSWDQQFGDFVSYEVAVSRKFKSKNGTQFSADLTKEQADRVFEKYLYWFDDPSDPKGSPGILKIPSFEEQALMVAKAYQSDPELLKFGWQDNPEFFTDDVNGVIKKRRSAVMPGSDEEQEEESVPTPRGRGGSSQADPSVSETSTDEFDEFEDEDEQQTEPAADNDSAEFEAEEPANDEAAGDDDDIFDDFEDDTGDLDGDVKNESEVAAENTTEGEAETEAEEEPDDDSDFESAETETSTDEQEPDTFDFDDDVEENQEALMAAKQRSRKRGSKKPE